MLIDHRRGQLALNRKNLEPLGFRSTHLLASPTNLGLHWRHGRPGIILFADGRKQVLGYWELTPQQLQDFKDDKLALVPEGYVGNAVIHRQVLYEPQIIARYPWPGQSTAWKAAYPNIPRTRKQLVQMLSPWLPDDFAITPTA